MEDLKRNVIEFITNEIKNCHFELNKTEVGTNEYKSLLTILFNLTKHLDNIKNLNNNASILNYLKEKKQYVEDNKYIISLSNEKIEKLINLVNKYKEKVFELIYSIKIPSELNLLSEELQFNNIDINKITSIDEINKIKKIIIDNKLELNKNYDQIFDIVNVKYLHHLDQIAYKINNNIILDNDEIEILDKLFNLGTGKDRLIERKNLMLNLSERKLMSDRTIDKIKDLESSIISLQKGIMGNVLIKINKKGLVISNSSSPEDKILNVIIKMEERIKLYDEVLEQVNRISNIFIMLEKQKFKDLEKIENGMYEQVNFDKLSEEKIYDILNTFLIYKIFSVEKNIIKGEIK